MTRLYITKWYESLTVGIYLNFLSKDKYYYISFHDSILEISDVETAQMWRDQCPLVSDLLWWEE